MADLHPTGFKPGPSGSAWEAIVLPLHHPTDYGIKTKLVIIGRGVFWAYFNVLVSFSGTGDLLRTVPLKLN